MTSNLDIDVNNKVRALEIQIDVLEQEIELMKKRFDNLWEIFQDSSNADSKFKSDLIELIRKL